MVSGIKYLPSPCVYTCETHIDGAQGFNPGMSGSFTTEETILMVSPHPTVKP